MEHLKPKIPFDKIAQTHRDNVDNLRKKYKFEDPSIDDPKPKHASKLVITDMDVADTVKPQITPDISKILEEANVNPALVDFIRESGLSKEEVDADKNKFPVASDEETLKNKDRFISDDKDEEINNDYIDKIPFSKLPSNININIQININPETLDKLIDIIKALKT